MESKDEMYLLTFFSWDEIFMYIGLQRRNEYVVYVDGGCAITTVSNYKSYLIMEETLLTKELYKN
jgi:hypothetical protein